MTRLIEKHVVWQYSQPARKNIPSGISATTSQQICLCDKCTLYSDQKRGEFSASIINNFQDTLNSQINTPAVTRSKLAVAYQNNVLSFTFMSLTVEPSLTLENTFVPCLSYWRFHPSTLSASRRKCSKSSALAARTSPTCIERPWKEWNVPSVFVVNGSSVAFFVPQKLPSERERNTFERWINFKDGCKWVPWPVVDF